MNLLHYFHVHDGGGSHADGETYSIVTVCDAHVAHVMLREDAEHIRTDDMPDETCDVCSAPGSCGARFCAHIVNEYHDACGARLPCTRHK